MTDYGQAERIRVELIRTGGFGGLELHSKLDSEALPEAEARELVALVDQVDLDALAGGTPAGGTSAGGAASTAPGVPDAFQYRLSVQRGGRRWQGVFTESDIPAELRPLLTELTRHARQGRAGGPA